MLTVFTLQVLSGLVAGVVSLTALKAGAVDLQDERDVRQRGFDLIYEARDLDLDQSTRDGLTQYRKNIDSTKARIKEAEQILDTKLDPLIQKKYWYTFVSAIYSNMIFLMILLMTLLMMVMKWSSYAPFSPLACIALLSLQDCSIPEGM